ncbi:MAG: HDIG domain-containing metalloprotein [Vicinamibacterales bacterium]
MPSSLGAVTTPVTRGRWRRVFWRVRQFGHSIQARQDSSVDDALRALLSSEGQWRLLERLTPFDRAHHLRVYQILVNAGHDDAHLLRAALLHDVGKADERGRANALHRSVYVLARRFAPAVLPAIARRGKPLTHGLFLTGRHAVIGATMARGAGAPERTCELIARHGESPPTNDELLDALIAADTAAID